MVLVEDGEVVVSAVVLGIGLNALQIVLLSICVIALLVVGDTHRVEQLVVVGIEFQCFVVPLDGVVDLFLVIVGEAEVVVEVEGV